MGISLQKVSFHYTKNQSKDGINNLDLIINEGDFLCICGATGSGKSTLVAHLNALLLPQSGSLKIDEYSIPFKRSFNINLLRQKVGLSFQFPEYQLFANSVLADCMFGPLNFKFSKEQAQSSALRVLELLKISDLKDQSPLELSGGQMRKVAIAGIMASNPQYLVFDEPTRGLDQKASQELLQLFYQLNQEKQQTIIAITHDMDFVAKYASRVIVLKEGEIVFNGSKEELFESHNFSNFGLDYPSTIKVLKYLSQETGLVFKPLYQVAEVLEYLQEKA
ncbi:MAG: ATP-binding cassette domain-containing protein [Acholeplasmatales bacterium]|jgi:energy-coupling factor transport system ATP-binding protein|nr:ATP-binding cassette domain-containing protein [Acholeplasmatales bacterium]